MRPFRAHYPGTCATCSERIRVDDEVVYVDDELTYADCADTEHDGRQRQPAPCPRCWTVHRGECL